MENLFERLRLADRGVLIAAGSVTLVSVLSMIYSARSSKPRLYRAPAKAAIKARANSCPYHQDAIPGGRDVETPFGNIRAYEWGPENGRKVLFVHGISTPCISLAALAERLARQGCRVMLFDLFGRGYSDSPDPRYYRQDMGLFSSQILAVLASSEVNWMAGFTMVGYSLGGGISASFTYYYPQLVESLVLVAPSGLMRLSRISWRSKLLYGKILPEPLVHFWVGRRMRSGADVPRLRDAKKKSLNVTNVVNEEVPGGDVSTETEDSRPAIFDDRPAFNLNTSVVWQTDSHPGFVPAFVSSIQNAPIHFGHEQWKTIGRRCEAVRAQLDGLPGLYEGRVLILLGAQDTVTLADETIEDATAALGRDNVTIKLLKGGHDLPSAGSDACMEAIMEHWESAL